MATAPASPFTFALVGAGRVGTAVAELLRRAGHGPAAIASRTPESSERAARLLEAPVFAIDALPPVDVVLIGATDDAISGIASQIAPRLAEGTVVVHFAGALGLEPLRPVLGVGGQRAALHPVQACPDIDTAIKRIPGCAWGVVADEGLAEWSADVVEKDLSGHPYWIPDVKRPVWHAAAVLVSNGLAGLLATAEELLASIGVSDPIWALSPLAAGTLENAMEGGGGAKTLTGPAVRGESATLERHLDGIDLAAPELARAYGLATMLTVEAAVRSGRLDDTKAEEMLEVLRKRA